MNDDAGRLPGCTKRGTRSWNEREAGRRSPLDPCVRTWCRAASSMIGVYPKGPGELRRGTGGGQEQSRRAVPVRQGRCCAALPCHGADHGVAIGCAGAGSGKSARSVVKTAGGIRAQ